MVTMGFVLAGMLYFGIRLKDFSSDNNVLWSSKGGLAFKRFAIAYTEGFFPDTQQNTGVNGLTVEMAIRPELVKRTESIKFILLIHAGENHDQFVIGQWRSTLIIMNGYDYSNAHRTPKIYLQLDKYEATPHLFTIVSTSAGTKVFVDGTLVKKNPDLVLKYPKDREQARMIIGNNLSGQRPWTGTMMGLALYDHDLADEDVKRHFRKWHQTVDVSAFHSDKPQLLYSFSKGNGNKIENRTGSDLDLIVPKKMTVFDKNILSLPKFTYLGIKSMSIDILVNLVGFIPLGFILIAILVLFDGIGDRTAIFIVVMIAFLFSLTIEIAQGWIPSRDSSTLDLVINSLGSGAGALIFRLTSSRYTFSAL
jgi:hypothetical protein